MRNHALDGLRAIASLSIVLYHLGLSRFRVDPHSAASVYWDRVIQGLGPSGVELFFTLSAVVLLRPYLRASRSMDAVTFFGRRFTRLWPAFFGAWLLAGATVALVSSHPTWWQSAMPTFSLRDWVEQLFIVYVGPNAYNFAWWTLTIEVMFYAIAPLLVALLAKRSATAMTVIFVSSVALALLMEPFATASSQYQVVLKFITFASCFCGGLFLAKEDISAGARIIILLVGVLIIVANVLETRVNGHVGYGLIYMAVVSEALANDSRLHALLSRPLLLWLGERSYSLFLTHSSVIALACWGSSLLVDRGWAYFLISRPIAILGSVAVACFLFEGVEKRFAHGLVTAGNWLPGRPAEAAKPEDIPVAKIG